MDDKRGIMISDGALKTHYVREILERDAKFINETQGKVISENLRRVSGRLLRSIYRNDFQIQADDNRMMLQFNFLRYLRFLDIKSSMDKFKSKDLRSKLALYNRVIYGRLYNETRSDIKYGFTEQIKDRIRMELEKAK
ncbi:MAG: hypothetical protein BGO30_08170 [Bacteroidetes bacterium 41-46]|jgi:Lhr-like helicase|nr:MAG: hypothetical protein BGO30_08170 [Bacteroidetes bacterium 41-46]